MSHRVRASRPGDLEPLYELAQFAGVGLTNLQPHREALGAKLARSAEAFGKQHDEPGDDLYLLVLEDIASGRLLGTAQIFSTIGAQWPFYSYRLSALTKSSREFGRTFRAETLTLTTDHDGASEVGGLFLDPGSRAGGLGTLLARSRYLFIRQHRARFQDRTIAELRGVTDQNGRSPFWDGLAGRFFGMTFEEADRFNALHGNQFIADLMPRHPIYVAVLDASARAAIGVAHPSGLGAQRMLEAEGFADDGYIDIFDGGPTLAAETDRIATVAAAATSTLASCDARDGRPGLAATGRLDAFRCVRATICERDDAIEIDARSAEALGVTAGDEILHVA